MNRTNKMIITTLLCTLTIISSHIIAIPLGFVRALPVQHLVNIILAVSVGTSYAFKGAFMVSLIRNFLGVGSIFAFPGSLFGAMFAGLVFKKTNHLLLTALAELMGTSLLGSLCSYPLATFVLGQEVTLFFFLPSFFFSSLVGSIASLFILKAFSPYWNYLLK